MITFAVTTSSDGFDCNVFTVGTYATMSEAADVARGHEFHHDVEARIVEHETSVYGVVTVPHYDI